jgi:hypothetical protein
MKAAISYYVVIMSVVISGVKGPRGTPLWIHY